MRPTAEAGPFGGVDRHVAAKDHDLVIALRKASQELVTGNSIRDLDSTLDNIVASAVEVVAGADEGGISRTDTRTGRRSHATNPVVHELDRLQSELDEGPCITAADEPPLDGLILARDLAGPDRDRWPSFAPLAVERGFRSVLSAQLSSRHKEQRSSLNLYSHAPDAFDEHDQVTAGLFAAQAGLLLHGADSAAGLNHALETRDVIARAKGILAERFTLTDAEAFQMLVKSSQETNIKLVDVARWLTDENEQRANARDDRAGDTP